MWIAHRCLASRNKSTGSRLFQDKKVTIQVPSVFARRFSRRLGERTGKYIEWKVSAPGVLEWQIDHDCVAADQALDGCCYVIRTTVSAASMRIGQVVASYKGLSKVNQAFRNLKTVSLELRPIHHRRDECIEAHAFLCILLTTCSGIC